MTGSEYCIGSNDFARASSFAAGKKLKANQDKLAVASPYLRRVIILVGLSAFRPYRDPRPRPRPRPPRGRPPLGPDELDPDPRPRPDTKLLPAEYS